jgi:TonB family protein
MNVLTTLLAMWVTFGGGDPIRAGKDAPVPESIRRIPPEYPSVARGAFPPVMGIIVLEVTLSEDGRPVDIRVLRGTPLIDAAAIEAVKQWRYQPTVIDGSPRSVVLREVVDVFPSEGAMPGYFASMLSDKKEAQVYRLLAIQRLSAMRTHANSVVKALTKATEDPDERIRGAATEALGELAGAGK